MRLIRKLEHRSTKSRVKWALAGAFVLVVIVAVLVRRREQPASASARPTASSARSNRYFNRSLFRPYRAPQNAKMDQLVISGRVYGLDGIVLPGAKVMAMSFAIAGNVATDVASIESDGEGRFELPVPDGTYQILANKAGYGPSYAHVRAGETVSLVLSASGTIKGHVFGAGGMPQRHFVIDVLTAGPDHLAAPVPLWTRKFESADGSFEITELPLWPIVVRASANDLAPGYSQALRVEPAQSRDIDIRLTEGCTLEGTVKDVHGVPVPFVFVDAESRVQSSGTSELSMDASNRAESDEDGHFRLEHAPMGRIAIRGYDAEHAPSTVVVDVADCKSATPIDIVMTDGGTIAGVARGRNGDPIAGARITASQRTIGFVNTIADNEGKFHIDALPAGNTRLELSHNGQRTSTTVRVAAGSVTNRDIVLYSGGTGEIRGRVTAGGTPLSGVQLMVAASRRRDHGLDMYFPLTGPDGSYQLLAIPEGHYAINVVSSGKTEGIDVSAQGISVLNLDMSAKRADLQ